MKFPFSLFLLSLLALGPVNASTRPNLLLIVCDDLNTYASTSGYSHIQTPNLVQFAAKGTVFRHTCQHPVGRPSRWSFLNGLYPAPLEYSTL